MSESISVGNREIAYSARGSGAGPAVLLLHGGGFDQRVWQHCATSLAKRVRVVSLDLPGHGRSRGPAIRRVEEGVQLIEDLRGSLGIDRWIFIGHSMGGAIAQAYAHTHPERVVALGLISTAPHFGLDPGVVEQWRGHGTSYSQERLDAIVGPGADEAMKAHVLALRDRMTPDGVEGDLETCASWDGRAYANEIALPVLLISTPHDLPVIMQATEMWARSLPQAERITLADAGHMMMVERPEETTGAVCDWVERVTEQSR
jgi:pimeloyl-ACP methyl ester carboxylesterase